MTDDQLTPLHPDYAEFIEHLIREQDYEADDIQCVRDEPRLFNRVFVRFLERKRTKLVSYRDPTDADEQRHAEHLDRFEAEHERQKGEPFNG